MRVRFRAHGMETALLDKLLGFALIFHAKMFQMLHMHFDIHVPS